MRPALPARRSFGAAGRSKGPCVLLYNGGAYANISLKRSTLLLSLPASPYVAFTTLRRGSRIFGIESNLLRLLTSAAAATKVPTAGAGEALAVGAEGRDLSLGGESRWKPSVEEFERFKARVLSDLRVLLRVFHFSVSATQPNETAGTPPKAAREARGGAAAEEGELLLPEGYEASVTIALTHVELPDLLGALGLPVVPSELKLVAAEAEAGAALPQGASASKSFMGEGAYGLYASQGELQSALPLSFRLVLLAEPLVPSPAVFFPSAQPQPPLQLHRPQQGAIGLSDVSDDAAASCDLAGTGGSSASSSNSKGSCSSSSSSGTANNSPTKTDRSTARCIRCCNVLVLPHRARAQPEMKSTAWVTAREPLLQGGRSFEALYNKPVEEVLLESDRRLVEGCSSNFLVYSAARGCVLTAPDSMALPGSTRGLAVRALAAKGIETVYEAPRWSERETEKWEAAWISSSSRLLLPVRSLIKPKDHLQQLLQQQDTWIAVASCRGIDSPICWLVPAAEAQQAAHMRHEELMMPPPHQEPQMQQEAQEEQQEGGLPVAEYEEFTFAVDAESLAARAAAWTADLAEQEAEVVF